MVVARENVRDAEQQHRPHGTRRRHGVAPRRALDLAHGVLRGRGREHERLDRAVPLHASDDAVRVVGEFMEGSAQGERCRTSGEMMDHLQLEQA